MSTSNSNLSEIYKQNTKDDFVRLLRENNINSAGLDKYGCFQLIADKNLEINGMTLDPNEVCKEKYNIINSYKSRSKTTTTEPVNNNNTSDNEETFQETWASPRGYTQLPPIAPKTQLSHTDSFNMEHMMNSLMEQLKESNQQLRESNLRYEEQLRISNKRYDDLAAKYDAIHDSPLRHSVLSKQILSSSEIKQCITLPN